MAYVSQERKKSIEPAIKAILKEHGLKGSLGVHHHSTLVLNIKEGPIDFIGSMTSKSEDKYIQVNPYHVDSNYTGKARSVLRSLLKVMNNGNHDNSDIMTDYHDVGWYVSINIGKWDQPYVLK